MAASLARALAASGAQSNSVPRLVRAANAHLPAQAPWARQAVARAFHATRRSEESKRDFYEVLGIDRTADKSAVKKAYYKLAKKYHPDANPGDEKAAERFTELQNAYEVLSDDEKRERYDSFGMDAFENGFDGDGPFGAGGGMSAEDIFNSFFGGGGGGGGGGNPFDGFGGGRQRQTGPVRGSDIQVQMSISFLEAVHGTTKEVSCNVDVECNTCDGTGSADKSEPVTCRTCGGSGQVTRTQGFFTMAMPCSACGGSGQAIENPCGTCRGNGVRKQARTVQVSVPPGVDTGINMRLANQGDKGRRGGPPGHIYVTIQVRPDPFFRRDGAHVHVELPVPLSTAVLGGEVAVPTLTGEAQLKVPAGTQPTDTLVMRGKGIRRLNSSSHGHQYVHFKVEVPKALTDRQRELMREFQQEEGSQPDTSAGFVKSTLDRLAKALRAGGWKKASADDEDSK